MNGNAPACEATLRSEKKRLEHLSQKDLREQTTALLTDDKAVAWTGREFEQRMLDSLLILSSLVGNRHDAFAHSTVAMDAIYADEQLLKPEQPSEIVTVSNKEETVPAPARLSANAFAAWLHAAVHSEKAMDADLTDRSLKLVSYWNGQKDETSIRTLGTRTAAGHGVVNVVTFVDRITDWESERAAPTSAAMLIADQLLSALGDHTLPPTIAPVAIARPKQNTCANLLTTCVRTAGKPTIVRSHRLLDLNKAAWDSYQHDRNDQIARAVVRRIVKKGAVYAAKDQMAVGKDSGVDVALNVAGIVWEALEKPDTRHIRLLPASIEIAQLELPEGRHQIELYSDAIKVADPATGIRRLNVAIENGRNSFVLAYRSGSRITQIAHDDTVELDPPAKL